MSLYKASDARYTQMEYAPCGRSGLKLPRVSLGLWQNFGSVNAYDNAREMCLVAFDHGITHFDLANNYGPVPGSAEENFGRILREDLHPYRDELIISTKAGYDMWDGPYGSGGSRKYLIASLDASLRRMGLDYVDIFYHHRMTPETPLEESMEALAQIVRSGKALYVGLSNYDGPTMQRAAAILASLHVPFVINQNRYSILCRLPEKNGLLEAAAQAGKGVICFSPLAQGLLTDRYLGGIPQDSRAARNATLKQTKLGDDTLACIRGLNDLAAARGQTLAEMALAWVLRGKAVTSVLVGASSPAQILDNLGALRNTAFTAEELAAIDRLSDGIEY